MKPGPTPHTNTWLEVHFCFPELVMLPSNEFMSATIQPKTLMIMLKVVFVSQTHTLKTVTKKCVVMKLHSDNNLAAAAVEYLYPLFTLLLFPRLQVGSIFGLERQRGIFRAALGSWRLLLSRIHTNHVAQHKIWCWMEWMESRCSSSPPPLSLAGHTEFDVEVVLGTWGYVELRRLCCVWMGCDAAHRDSTQVSGARKSLILWGIYAYMDRGSIRKSLTHYRVERFWWRYMVDCTKSTKHRNLFAMYYE